jgi:TPR repeat protein
MMSSDGRATNNPAAASEIQNVQLDLTKITGYSALNLTAEAFQQLHESAVKGNTNDQCLLAWYYRNGVEGVGQTGTPAFLVGKDLEAAFHWYQLSAEAGNATAQNNLGTVRSSNAGASYD